MNKPPMRAQIEQLRCNLERAASGWQNSLPLSRVMTEWEVVFLLGVLAGDAGITLAEGSDSYPDAFLVLDDDETHTVIRTEIEYAATNFNHDPAGCDLVLCWLADVPAIGGVPVIGLRQWFPNVQSVGVTTIRHDNKPPELQQIFRAIDDWVRNAGLQPVDTARNQAFTKSHRYFVRVGGKNLSLCTVEYMPESAPEYVEFRFQGNTLRERNLHGEMDGCWEQVKALAGQVPGIEPRHTGGTNEYKIRLYPQVLGHPAALASLTTLCDPVLRRAV